MAASTKTDRLRGPRRKRSGPFATTPKHPRKLALAWQALELRRAKRAAATKPKSR